MTAEKRKEQHLTRVHESMHATSDAMAAAAEGFAALGEPTSDNVKSTGLSHSLQVDPAV